jgi:GT2 family glycosyltransferase
MKNAATKLMNKPLSPILSFVRRALASCHRIITWAPADMPATIKPVPTESDDVPSGLTSSGRWLQIVPPKNIPAGKWISIKYSMSVHDELVRPVLRFKTPVDDRLNLLPAPLFGSGAWIGYVPPETIEIQICVSESSRHFGFRCDAFVVVSAAWPFAMAVSREPRLAVGALLMACRGLPSKARERLSEVIRSHPLQSYDSWRRQALRAIEPDSLDYLGPDRAGRPHIRVIVEVTDEAPQTAIEASLRSLAQQDYDDWSVTIVGGSERGRAAVNAALSQSSIRAVFVPPDTQAEQLWAQLDDSAFVVPLSAGGMVPSYALSSIANFSATHPDYEVIYADEDHLGPDGKYHDPLLKPDWSPLFQRTAGYMGRAIYLRCTALLRCGPRSASEILCDGLLHEIALSSPAPCVGHLRRVLLTSPMKRIPSLDLCAPEPWPPVASLNVSASRPLATVIIPTRDRADLLEACLESLGRTVPGNFEVLIVDSNSSQSGTFSFYDRIAVDSRIKILRRPGPFNFSALCNSAALEVTTPVMVFLNNDAVVQTPDWLGTLSAWALRPEIGAVGTRLIYPSGLLQHAGVVIGLAGYAAHNDRNATSGEPGYMRKLAAAREVSAITAACMAIEKAKFEAVGGFDERTFPIELGDMDLCLRLRATGWTTICLSEPTLIHRESASRGTAADFDLAYGRERRAFRDRWYPYIRDDPYFHPALSLHSIAAALDH